MTRRMDSTEGVLTEHEPADGPPTVFLVGCGDTETLDAFREAELDPRAYADIGAALADLPHHPARAVVYSAELERPEALAEVIRESRRPRR